MIDSSRKASWRERSPSRNGPACWEPISGRRRGHQAGKGGDQLAGLVQVLEFLGIFLGGEAELYRGGAHQVHGGGGDDLDRGDFRDVADLLRDVGLGGWRARRRGNYCLKCSCW